MLFVKNTTFFEQVVFKLSRKFLSKQETSHYNRLPYGYNNPSAFSLFIKDYAKSGEKASEIVKKVSKIWKDLDLNTKKKYFDRATAEGVQRRKDFQNLSDEEKFKLFELTKTIKEKSILRKRRKLLQEQKKNFGRPKQPLNAYALFVKDYLTHHQSDSPKKLFLDASVMWKSLDHIKKKEYEFKAKEQKEVYLIEFKKWKEENESIFTDKTNKLLQKFKKIKLS